MIDLSDLLGHGDDRNVIFQQQMKITINNLKEEVVVRQNYQGVARLGKSS